MRSTFNPAGKALAALIVTGSIALAGTAIAQEVTSLRGKPSSDMILEALSGGANADAPAAPAPKVRRRGLSLGNDESSEAPAAPAQAAPAPAAVTTSATPVVASAPVVQQQRSQPRALDLDIQFQFNSDQLTNDGKDVLDQLAAALKSDKLASARAIILEGHADAKGSPAYNQALSLKRAQSARSYLSSRHEISAGKLKAVGKGSSEPADPNNPEDEVNRRVRVIVDL